ncbi:MAG: helix-turn-helix domain-containing protein [Proteobacteria bacterium]|nr:helix-turn-helix domain-containing protein [Pseudomonadota bacterium]
MKSKSSRRGVQAQRLINEVRLTYQSLVQIGERLHAGSSLSLGMRAVLEYLQTHSAATVPDIARARRVTRQRIQTLVNQLIDLDLVSPTANPASLRSPLITLTEGGRSSIQAMQQVEGRLLEAMAVSAADLARAAAILADVRTGLEQITQDSA